MSSVHDGTSHWDEPWSSVPSDVELAEWCAPKPARDGWGWLSLLFEGFGGLVVVHDYGSKI